MSQYSLSTERGKFAFGKDTGNLIDCIAQISFVRKLNCWH